MTTKTTDTTAGFAAPHPARLTDRQVCLSCKHLDLEDTIAALDGVGWCQQHNQYRAVTIKRACSEFSNRFLTTEG